MIKEDHDQAKSLKAHKLSVTPSATSELKLEQTEPFVKRIVPLTIPQTNLLTAQVLTAILNRISPRQLRLSTKKIPRPKQLNLSTMKAQKKLPIQKSRQS
jgi:hypothetical protein